MSTYFVTFPVGIEDAVRAEFLRFAKAFCSGRGHVRVKVLSGDVPKEQLAVMRKRQHKEARKESKEENLPPAPPADRLTIRGALYFSVDVAPECANSEDEYDFVYQLGFSLRTIDQVCLSLDVFPMRESTSEMNPFIAARRDFIHDAVLRKLGGYRAWLGAKVRGEDSSYTHRLPGFFFGDSFLTPLTDDSVLLRVNSLRRDKAFAENAPAIASHVGDQLVEHFYPRGWRVSMIYHHVEFYLLHDHARVAHMGLVFSAPAFPRTGMDLNLARQLFLELLRQRIGRQLWLRNSSSSTTRAVDVSSSRGLITRPSTMRYEMRLEKGENAMLVPLAAALVCYADTGSSAEQKGEPLLLLDPFGGSGTLLTEAWVAGGLSPLSSFCGELAEEDHARAVRNLSPTVATALALFNGLSALPTDSETTPLLLSKLEKWRAALEHLVNSIPLSADRDANAAAIEEAVSRTGSGGLDGRMAELLNLLGGGHVPRIFNAPVSLLRADATQLPLRSGTMHRVVSDMPFGRRCGNHRANTHLYPLFLRECYRVLSSDAEEEDGASHVDAGDHPPRWWQRPSRREKAATSATDALGGRAVLLTLDAKFMLETLEVLKEECPFQMAAQPFTVEMAGLFPYVFVLDKVVKGEG